MKKLLPSFLSFAFFASSCAQINSSTLHQNPSPSKKDIEARLSNLKIQAILDQDFLASLEMFFVLNSLKSSLLDKEIAVVLGAEKPNPEKVYAEVYEPLNILKAFGYSGTVAGPVALAYIVMGFHSRNSGGTSTSFPLGYPTRYGSDDVHVLSFGIAGITVLAGSSLALYFLDKEHQKKMGGEARALTDEEKDVLIAQIKGDAYIDRDFDALVSFLNLSKEDVREFRAHITKEVLASVDESKTPGVVLKEELVRKSLDGKLTFLNIAKKFSPAQNQEMYRERLAFLQEIETAFASLDKTPMHERSSKYNEQVDYDAARYRLFILRAYQQGLTNIEPKMTERKVDFEKAKVLVDNNIQKLEKLIELRKDR